MAIIKPFKSVRPDEKYASQVAALPYDVYNRQEAKEVVKDHPYSFLNIDRAETQFSDEVSTYDDCVYQKAKELLDCMIEKKIFIQDEKECYYIYQLTMDGRAQTGLVACASIDDYMNNVIKKHENTREEKELDRIHHVDTCNAQTGPIFLAYRANALISKIVSSYLETPCLYDFVSDDKIIHKVWKIEKEEDVKTIKETFEQIQEIYIADGHHRCASAVKVGLKRREENPGYKGDEEFNYFLSVLFPDEELMILPYNRVVADLNGMDKEEFLKKVSTHFEWSKVDQPVWPKEKASFGMFLEDEWYLLKAKEDILSKDPVEGLDVSILQNHLLGPILGIGDPRVDKRIDFVGGIRGLEELEKRSKSDMHLAFSMYPTSIAELFSVADAGRLMPPKSTWFEPKLRSGLFIHML